MEFFFQGIEHRVLGSPKSVPGNGEKTGAKNAQRIILKWLLLRQYANSCSCLAGDSVQKRGKAAATACLERSQKGGVKPWNTAHSSSYPSRHDSSLTLPYSRLKCFKHRS